MKCNACGDFMRFACYGYESECNAMEYGGKHATPIPLKCYDCGMNDWKHEHNTRWAVWLCDNVNCNNPDTEYKRDWVRWFDYSRLPFPAKSLEGSSECRALEIEFGVSDRRELKRLGKRLKIKNIDKRMKKVHKLLDKFNYHELYEMAQRKLE